MLIEKRLTEIWASDYINTLPALVKDRGFCYSANTAQKEILITGINPSFRKNETEGNKGFDGCQMFFIETYDNYVAPMQKMLSDGNIDLRQQAAYLDLFYFREEDQKIWREKILPTQGGIPFAVDQLNLTQHIIEDIVKPKLIVVKNKESWAYWGKLIEEGLIWMGYQFEFVQKMVCGELWKITGLLNSNERIAPEFTKTNLQGSYVLFTQHINQYTKVEERPTPIVLKTILDWYDAEKNARNLAI
jgi:hypothetical protein